MNDLVHLSEIAMDVSNQLKSIIYLVSKLYCGLLINNNFGKKLMNTFFTHGAIRCVCGDRKWTLSTTTVTQMLHHYKIHSIEQPHPAGPFTHSKVHGLYISCESMTKREKERKNGNKMIDLKIYNQVQMWFSFVLCKMNFAPVLFLRFRFCCYYLGEKCALQLFHCDTDKWENSMVQHGKVSCWINTE